MRIVLTLTLGALICQPLTSFADPCTDVVADTVAELRAGADGWWSEDIEGLVRAAAGSACIKAQSRRYQASDPTASAANVEAGNTQGSAQGPVQESPQASVEAEAQGVKEDDGSWNFGGLTIRSMSGSPSQKPYERARQTKQTDKDKENGS